MDWSFVIRVEVRRTRRSADASLLVIEVLMNLP